MRQQRRLIAAIAIPVLVLAGFLGNAQSAHAKGAGDPPMGVMIQVSSLAPATSPAALKSWLEDIRRDHHDARKPGYVNAVVLQDIADSAGTLYTAYLDVIAPYLPGGATPIFTQAYVGTVDLPWTGSGSKYLDGIEDANFRSQNVNVSVAAATAFHARYPRIVNSWYITYEANLAGFWDANLASAYRTYLVSLINALSPVAGRRDMLWSPAFWTMYSDEPAWAMPDLKTNLGKLFAGLPARLTLSIQDFVGQSDGASTPASAASWIGYLKQNWSKQLAAVQVNVEQFNESGNGALTADSSSDLTARESFYQGKGITLGAAWEIRYWHARLYGN